MKLSDYAKEVGITYRTAWDWYKSGRIKGYQVGTGTIIITELDNDNKSDGKSVIYARVSSHSQKMDLDRQVDRLSKYAISNGIKIDAIVKEIASGMNDTRPKLNKVLKDEDVRLVLVEHKDRLTRFGFNYIETLLSLSGRRIEVANSAIEGQDDLLQDLMSVVYSFCARMYGSRRAKAKSDIIKKELVDDNTQIN